MVKELLLKSCCIETIISEVTHQSSSNSLSIRNSKPKSWTQKLSSCHSSRPSKGRCWLESDLRPGVFDFPLMKHFRGSEINMVSSKWPVTLKWQSMFEYSWFLCDFILLCILWPAREQCEDFLHHTGTATTLWCHLMQDVDSWSRVETLEDIFNLLVMDNI